MGIKITFHIAAMSVNESRDFDNTANQDNTNVSCIYVEEHSTLTDNYCFT